jgi:hypothetical protein
MIVGIRRKIECFVEHRQVYVGLCVPPARRPAGAPRHITQRGRPLKTYDERMAADARLCTVYIRDATGAPYGANVSAASSHDAARQAVALFNDPFWKGPKPTAETVLEITPMGGERVRVRVGDAIPPAIQRLLDEVRVYQPTPHGLFDRAHNRHNR